VPTDLFDGSLLLPPPPKEQMKIIKLSIESQKMCNPVFSPIMLPPMLRIKCVNETVEPGVL
jgi:hypothetical protein